MKTEELCRQPPRPKMRGAESAMDASEGYQNKRTRRKPVEKFNQWKKTSSSKECSENVSDAVDVNEGANHTKGNSMSSGMRTSSSKAVEQSNRFQKGGGHADLAADAVERQALHGTSSRQGRGNIGPTRSSASKDVGRVFCGHDSEEQGVRTLEENVGERTSATERRSVDKSLRSSSYSQFETTKRHGVSGKFPRIVQEEHNEDILEEQNENDEESTLQRTQLAIAGGTGTYTLDSDEGNVNGNSDTEEERDALLVGEDEISEDAHEGREVEASLYLTEAQRRKERRQERALREKEGNVRRKGGLPRNFLLVDEYTRKPYGVGVGDWRKELMLLSKNLDPTIGNINRQPDGAVAEIVEWIQHTWEYSIPMKYEYVKEVIARGVTLRRGELWKKIRNGEDKPSGLSDRSWRTLQRQLENPASIRKSENCRKANASRLNFGRTGPSWEVGVRQRLRRILRRSPEPEEIMYEMSRDKGYGSRHENKENYDNVMHEKHDRGRSTLQVKRICEVKSNLEDKKNENDEEETIHNEENKVNTDGIGVEGMGEENLNETLTSMSAEHISKHPFVLKIMQRLQALERKRSENKVHRRQESIEDGSSNEKCQEIEETEEPRVLRERQTIDIEGATGKRQPGRPKKKAKQG